MQDMRIIKLTQYKLDNPEILLQDLNTVAISDINGLLVRIFRRKKFIRVIYIHRCTWQKKRIEVRLHVTTLSDARKISAQRINSVRNNIHPDLSCENIVLTIRDAVDEYRNKKCKNWSERTLEEYNNIVNLHIIPNLGNVLLKDITVSLIKIAVLDNLAEQGKYNTLKKTISFLRSIMEHMCNIYHDQRFDDLHRLAKVYDIPRGQHFKSMVGKGTIEDIQKNISLMFSKISKLKCRSVIPKLALEINFYLLLRVSELINIQISDIDFAKHLVHVRKTKTISERDGGFHVPLSNHAESLLQFAISLKINRQNNFVFESKTESGHASERTIIDLFYQTELPMTIHGIRALGRTWLGLNNVKFEFAEACLSHKVGNQTVQAYLRTDFFEERRLYMQKWSDFLQRCIGENSAMPKN